MSTELVPLAVMMGLATYPWRAVPLLLPGVQRLPAAVQTYLRFVGPSALATLAAVSVMVALDPQRRPSFHVGLEWLAVGACLAVVAVRKNLFVGLLAAAGLMAAARALGLVPV